MKLLNFFVDKQVKEATVIAKHIEHVIDYIPSIYNGVLTRKVDKYFITLNNNGKEFMEIIEPDIYHQLTLNQNVKVIIRHNKIFNSQNISIIPA